MPNDEFSRFENLSLAYIIQNLVLYDVLLVDSVLLDTSPDVAEAINLFPDVIFGVHLKWSIREEIGQIVDRVAGPDPLGSEGPPEGVEPQHWGLWRNKEHGEKPLMDEMAAHVPALLPASYANDPEVIVRLERNFRPDFPLFYTTSGMTVARAHFYLELSRYLKIPFAADPIRSSYFEFLTARLKLKREQGLPEQVVARFDQSAAAAGGPEFADFVSVDLSLPPVVEYVAKYAAAKGCTLYEAVMEVRNSTNAVRFREWCSRLRTVLDLGRAGTAQRQEMVRGLQAVCEAWKKDVRERVNYRTRKVSLESIPLLGGILKAVTQHELEVKDPVITVDRTTSYLLFLNDLLRSPRAGATRR